MAVIYLLDPGQGPCLSFWASRSSSTNGSIKPISDDMWIFLRLILNCVSMCGHVHNSACLKRPETLTSPGAGVSGNCEPLRTAKMLYKRDVLLTAECLLGPRRTFTIKQNFCSCQSTPKPKRWVSSNFPFLKSRLFKLLPLCICLAGLGGCFVYILGWNLRHLVYTREVSALLLSYITWF